MGGILCQVRRYPFLVQILTKNKNGENLQHCAGTLIRSDLVLTAGHCAVNQTMWVKKSQYSVPDREDDGTTVVIKKFVHPSFKHVLTNTSTGYNGKPMKTIHVRHDIAIFVILITTNMIHWRRNLVQLPQNPVEGEMCNFCSNVHIMGWGKVNKTHASINLKCQSVRLAPTLECVKEHFLDHQFMEQKKIMCSTTQGILPLKGDSGGPVLCKRQQVGIISWGREKKGLAIYTRVDQYLDFINNIIETTDPKRQILERKWTEFEQERVEKKNGKMGKSTTIKKHLFMQLICHKTNLSLSGQVLSKNKCRRKMKK